MTVGEVRAIKLELTRLLFLTNGKEIACCGNADAQGWAGIINIDTGKIKQGIRKHTNVVMALGVSTDGTRAVSRRDPARDLCLGYCPPENRQQALWHRKRDVGRRLGEGWQIGCFRDE